MKRSVQRATLAVLSFFSFLFLFLFFFFLSFFPAVSLTDGPSLTQDKTNTGDGERSTAATGTGGTGRCSAKGKLTIMIQWRTCCPATTDHKIVSEIKALF